MKCENCGNEHNGSYGSGRFCSVKCSKGFSTKAKRKEINEKVSKTLNKNKITKCSSCGKILNKRRKFCDDCYPLIQRRSLYKKLNILDENLKVANKKALDFLKKEYFINNQTSLMIKEKYKIQLNTLYFFFQNNGISLKNNSEANINSIDLGRQTPQDNFSYGNCKRGWYNTWENKKVYLRSSYEFNYAKILDSYQIKYDVESKRIKYFDTIENKQRIAIVDFYLPETNTLSEVKSSYTLDLQNMKDRVKAYKEKGYNFKLILNNKETHFC